MIPTVKEAIEWHSSDAIISLSELKNTLFECSVGLDVESQEFKCVCADIKRIEAIQKCIQDLDILSNPFGLSNFPFCNKK